MMSEKQAHHTAGDALRPSAPIVMAITQIIQAFSLANPQHNLYFAPAPATSRALKAATVAA